jgi:tetrahydrodipicolinate N-succinyltransferase
MREDKCVVAGATVKVVAVSVADQCVVVIGTYYARDADKRIRSVTSAHVLRGEVHVDSHAARCIRITRQIHAAIADQCVVARAAFQHVVSRIAGQGVVVARADEIRDAD